MSPKGPYLVCILVTESLLSSYFMHKRSKGKSAQLDGPKPLCVFRRAPKSSHLICIIVIGGEGHCSTSLRTNLYIYTHKHFNHTLNSYFLFITYFKFDFLFFILLSCIYSKSIIKPIIILFNNKYQYLNKTYF